MPIRAVWFDVGEVLVDETREYGTWADWLGVPRRAFSAVFGAVIARGQDYRDVFQVFRPGFDLDAERQKRIDAGCGEALDESDLYPADPAFFQRLLEASDREPEETAYVGDRLDNDVYPAAAGGLSTFRVRRGPWALIQGISSRAQEVDSIRQLMQHLVPSNRLEG